jgi:predicted lipoprotein
VNLGPQPQTGGTWSWTGPNGFTSTSRVLNSIALTSGTNVYTVTYTNADGVAGTPLSITITINPTPIVPYLQVNGGPWQQVSTVTVNAGDMVNLGPQPQSGGTWSWTGPNGFTSTSRSLNNIALTSASNVYTATYTNTDGVTSTQAFTITVSPTQIVPYLQVNGGAWQQASTVTVNAGDTVNLGPQPGSGGTWSWTGPNSFTSTSRSLNNIALPSPSNVYTATYTNTDGVTSTQAFTITINPTPIVPYLQVNGGPWQQVSTVTVNAGDMVNLGPQPQSGGSWSWTGPSGFSSTSRVINATSLPSPSNTYTATYTNTNGVNSTQAFTITVNSTPIVPYLQVNGGAWQLASSVAVNAGATVNLGPQPQSGGTWSWTGPSGFSSTSRVLNGLALTSASNVYTVTYTNTDGVTSTQIFTITVNPTPIVPYVQVNGGAWQQASSVAVNVGDTVNLGPQPLSGGTWSWTGPSEFSSTSRVLNAIPLTTGSNVYTATYTNADGVNSTQTFTITIN